MELARKYYFDPAGIQPPTVNGIEITRLSPSGNQHFSPKLVAMGEIEQWLSISKDKKHIVIHEAGGDIPFKILREPGRYCCHCGVKLEDDNHLIAPGEAARKHVADEHEGEVSPDVFNPAGYEKINYFDCKVQTQ